MSLSPSIRAKLGDLTDRYEEIARLLADPETLAARDRFTTLSNEYAELEDVVRGYRRLARLTTTRVGPARPPAIILSSSVARSTARCWPLGSTPRSNRSDASVCRP